MITHTLPISLQEYKKNYVERIKRKNDLSQKSKEFINRFIAKNNIYYTPQNELFIQYKENHFQAYSEDNILHNILTLITQEQELRSWKHKIKINILKKIKDRSLLHAIPESDTIQCVINQLCPTVFLTKNRAKYFLTIVGDCLLQKNDQDIVYICHPYLKHFIGEIGLQAHAYFGIINAFQKIKYKFYDHNFNTSRLLSVIHTKRSIIPWNMYKHMLDLFCVAAHYSIRYGSADTFLKKCRDSALVKHAQFLMNHTQSDIVTMFLMDYTIKCENSEITSKNMIFIWKTFLDKLDIPNIIFHSSLHTMLKTKLDYDETRDAYINITSPYLPTMATFLTFWQETIMADEEDNENELEVEEIPILFQKWETINNKQKSTNIITDNDICIDLIKHFYPNISIENDKYILNIKCSLWDKRQEVINALETFKQSISGSPNIEPSLNGAYLFYTQKAIDNELVISKRYFEKVALEVLEQYIDSDGLILASWF